MGPGFESLRAHHKISLTNAVSLRNFSATRSPARSVAFSLPHENKKFPHESQRIMCFFLHKNGCICRILCTYINFISDTMMGYMPLYLCVFQSAIVAGQPCLFRQYCRFFVRQIPWFHDEHSLNPNVRIPSSNHQNAV